LATLAGTYGYTAYGLGLVDVGRIAGTFLDEQSGVNDALLKLMEHDRTTLSDVCRDEIRAVAGVVPRVVAGYTEMSTERITSKSVIELRGDLATGLQQITAPVPGLGQEHGGLLSLGMSIDLPALREFYSARLDALEADPFECELFADAQSGVAAGRAALQKPLPPAVYSFHGFLAVIDDIKGMDIAKKQPPTDIDMRFLLASSNAQGLVAMGAMFSPQIAELDLKPDSKPVKLDLPAGAAPISEAWVAMSEDALAVSVGAGGAAALTELMTSSAAEPSPFMSMDVDAGRYYGFLGDTLATAEPAGADEKAAPREVIEATEELMTSFRDVFDRISFDIQFTERGVEIPSTMALADNDT
ncbi:MAG TPA: hypothetical protein VE175_01130, partial [Woeseiaceae bacterium]|nr:hypothetical protein [Woeseiaceae bacterium]